MLCLNKNEFWTQLACIVAPHLALDTKRPRLVRHGYRAVVACVAPPVLPGGHVDDDLCVWVVLDDAVGLANQGRVKTLLNLAVETVLRGEQGDGQ